MRKTIKQAAAESINDMIAGGFSTSFSDREQRMLGVKIKEVQNRTRRIRRIRKKTHV